MRQFPKSLAIALNYDIPNLASGDLSSIRSVANYTVPTVYNDLEFAHISPTRNGGFNSYSIYGITVHVQNTSNTDIVFKLYSLGSQINDIQFTLPANTSSFKYNDNLTTPIISGIDPAQICYIKCVQSNAPSVKAEGVELTYFLHRI